MTEEAVLLLTNIGYGSVARAHERACSWSAHKLVVVVCRAETSLRYAIHMITASALVATKRAVRLTSPSATAGPTVVRS